MNESITTESDRKPAEIRKALIFETCLTMLGIAGGIAANSMAVLSGALHDLGNASGTAAEALIEYRYGKHRKKPSTGCPRISISGLIMSSAVKLAGSIFIISEAIRRLFSPEAVNAPLMLTVALIGIACNTAAVIKKRNNHKLNEKAVLLSLASGLVCWTAVLAGSIALMFSPFPGMDSVISIAAAVYTISGIIPSIHKAFMIVQHYLPSSPEVGKITEELGKIDGIIEIREMQLWSLGGANHFFSAQIAVSPECGMDEASSIVRRSKTALYELGIIHSTFEVERQG